MAASDDVREVRLAVVCYGGVSLAIYMHGITKEIHKLVLASTHLATHPEKENPFPTKTTEHVYWNLLSGIAAGTVAAGGPQARLRVVVDVISGTSAGGINGVYLAKALAGNRSQEALKKLWFEQGDIKQLLAGRRWVPWWARAGWRAVGAVARPRKVKPPLRGPDMCVWLYDALKQMDKGAKSDPPTLIPEGQDLELFVPITDFQGYEQQIALYDPRYVSDRTHRHVMRFRHGRDGHHDLDEDANHMLAFAARATSSFPGAFPPISFGEYERSVKDDPPRGGLKSRVKDFFPLYEWAHFDPEATWFIDGGVLDNFPFKPSIDAVAAKPATAEVDRRLLYIEPDPGEAAGPGAAGGPPGIYTTVFGGYAAIPRKEPILDDLLKLAQRNEAVLRVRDVIEAGFSSISGRVTQILEEVAAGDMGLQPSGEELAEFRAGIEERALREAGFNATTYLRLRIRTTVDGYSAAISDAVGFPPGAHHRALVTSVLRRMAERDKLLEAAPGDGGTQLQRAFLSTFDLAYPERRIRFLIAGLSWWYRNVGDLNFPSRVELDTAKETLYGHVRDLRAIVNRLKEDAGLVEILRGVFNEEELKGESESDDRSLWAFVDKHEKTLAAVRDKVGAAIADQLPGIEGRVHRDVMEFQKHWDPKVQGSLLTRYLGFPFWDVLVYPIEAMSAVGERDHIEVYRMSPEDVELLKPRPGDDAEGEELAGMGLAHFGAFFDRAGREGDYLMGRLHGAERLIKLLLDVRKEPSTLASGSPVAEEPDVLRKVLVAQCVPAFQAILAEEERELTHARERVQKMKDRVAALAATRSG